MIIVQKNSLLHKINLLKGFLIEKNQDFLLLSDIELKSRLLAFELHRALPSFRFVLIAE